LNNLAFTDIQTIAKSLIWNDFSEGLQKKVLAAGRIAEYQSGEKILNVDQRADTWSCLLSGALRISFNTSNGEETVFSYLAPGQWFGETALFKSGQGSPAVTAHTDSRLFLVPRHEYRELTTEFPELLVVLLRQQSERLAIAWAALQEQKTLSTEQQLARHLIDLSQRFGVVAVDKSKGYRIPFKLPQGELASLVGSSRQSVNKALIKFESDGLIEQHYGDITVLNRKGLRALLP
jgi:CRP/FNR family transcriptional regulator, cyclic AMP receptor protein